MLRESDTKRYKDDVILQNCEQCTLYIVHRPQHNNQHYLLFGGVCGTRSGTFCVPEIKVWCCQNVRDITLCI